MLPFADSLRPNVLHSLVDSFFECKKAQVKLRLRDSMEAIVDELFGELVGQVKEVLSSGSQMTDGKQTVTSGMPKQMNIESTPQGSKPKSPKPKLPTKSSVPVKSTASAPLRGIKRTLESTAYPMMATSSIQNMDDILDPETVSLPSPKRLFIDLDADNNVPEESGDTATFSIQENNKNTPVNSDMEQGKFICQSAGCDKRFKIAQHLKDHERVHANVRPYVCKYPGCTYASGKKSNTIRHIRTNHLKKKPSPGENPGENGDDGGELEGEEDPRKYLEEVQELLQ